jgi:predicted HicB family RNase H-like nuclease
MKADRVVVHLRLPRDLARLVKAGAARKGQSITVFVERTLRRALRRSP